MKIFLRRERDKMWYYDSETLLTWNELIARHEG